MQCVDGQASAELHVLTASAAEDNKAGVQPKDLMVKFLRPLIAQMSDSRQAPVPGPAC